MSWKLDLKVPFHQQETKYYCGAAVAQMILESIGKTGVDQATLYNSNHTHNKQNSGWSTDPQGLDYTLDHYKPATFSNSFLVREKTNEVEQSKALVTTLKTYKVAAAALVKGGDHWVVVRGAQTTGDPSGTYSINGFYVNDPWPPSAGPKKGTGAADTYIAYANWKARYMTACKYSGWKGKYVGVHDPREDDQGDLVPSEYGIKHDGSSVVRPNMAQEFAVAGGQEHGLHECESFGDVLTDGHHHEGVLVQSLDRRDAFYNLVPVEHGDGISATVMVDGLGGHLLGVQKYREPLSDFIISPEEARHRVLSTPIHFGDERGSIRVREEVLGQHPSLVWAPCQESRSPYYPFHMFHVGQDRIFVSHNGIVYPELTPMGAG